MVAPPLIPALHLSRGVCDLHPGQPWLQRNPVFERQRQREVRREREEEREREREQSNLRGKKVLFGSQFITEGSQERNSR